MSRRWTVALSEAAGGGSTLALVDAPTTESSRVLVLGHGAGTSAAHATMEALALAFKAEGFCVVRFDFPYRRPNPDGSPSKRPPDRMPKLVACVRDVLALARQRLTPKQVFVGGHSMGSRAAAHLAAGDFGAKGEQGHAVDGVLLCSYPLHPAGKPERLRDGVLYDLDAKGLRSLWISGTRDRLCTPEPYLSVSSRLGSNCTRVRLEGVDHGYGILKKSGQTRADVLAMVASHALIWSKADSP